MIAHFNYGHEGGFMCVTPLIQQEGAEAHTVALFSLAHGEAEVQCME